MSPPPTPGPDPAPAPATPARRTDPGTIPTPDRLYVPTCAGCGAMSRPGACPSGCSEHKLSLVRASTFDALVRARAIILADTGALLPVVRELADATLPADGGEAHYGALRERASAVLAARLDAHLAAFVLDEPAEPTVAWGCDRCPGVDGPQPCLGICVWRRVEWTRHDAYTDLRERVIGDYGTNQRLRALLWRLVHTRPHPGQHAQAWSAYAEQAAALLASSELR